MILKARAEKGSVSSSLRSIIDLLVSGLEPCDRRQVGRAGEIVDDGVEKQLDALVLERRSAEDRVEIAVEGPESNAGLDLLDGERRHARDRPRSSSSTVSATFSSIASRYLAVRSMRSSGMSTVSHCLPSSPSRDGPSARRGRRRR